MGHHTYAQICPAGVGRAMLALSLVACTFGAGPRASAQTLKFTIFDASAAGTGFFQGTNGVAINAQGEIVGYYRDSNYVFHGLLRSPDGTLTTFDGPHASTDAYGTFGIALNDLGVAVGYYTNAIYNYGGLIRRRDGDIRTYRYPKACTTGDPVGCEGTGTSAINDFGVVAGGYVDNNFVQHAFLMRPDGKVIAYDAPGAGTTAGNPNNISPLGDYLYQGTNVAGTAPGLNVWGAVTSAYLDGNNIYHGYVRSPEGSFTEFDAPGAGQGTAQGTVPVGLNDTGVITGYYLDGNYVFHGFAGRSDNLTDFDAPGAEGYGTFPSSLNDFGVVTGYYLDANGVYHGFLRRPNGDVLTFDAPGADLTPGDFNGTFPQTINVFGAITGNYVDANFVSHGFVAVPCYEECSDDEAATGGARVNPVVTANQGNPASPGVAQGKPTVIPLSRRGEARLK